MTLDADKAAQVEAQEMFKAAKDAMAEMKQQLKESKKDVAAIFPRANLDDAAQLQAAKVDYQSSLKVHVISDPAAPGAVELMTKMYGLYEKVFPIEEEREEMSKLLDLMGKNHDKELQASGAPFREQWILLEDKNGEIVGARNTIVFSAANNPEVPDSGSQHLIYGFVDPRFRALGLGDFTMKIAEDEARKFIASTLPDTKPGNISLLEVSEQNAPLLMSMSSMLTDTAGAKTDQFWRREYYESLGFREIDFKYVQLPLEPREDGGVASHELNLITRRVPAPDVGPPQKVEATSMDAASLSFHLYNFFDRSVAAGGYEVDSDPDWKTQASQLNGQIPVRPKLDFHSLKQQTWDLMEKYVNSPSFTAEGFSEVSVGDMLGVNTIPAQAKRAEAGPSPATARQPKAVGN